MPTIDVQAIAVARIDAQVAELVLGTNLFKGQRRVGAGVAVFVSATGGPSGQQHSHGEFDKPTVQVLTRGGRGKQEEARAMAVKVRDALHRQSWSDGGVDILQALAREPHPYPLDVDDDNDAAYYVTNVELWVAP